MRNIKTTLRYVRNSALLFAAASGMSYLTACQSENDITSPDTPDIPESTLKTASYSVYGPNQSRIHNYGTRGTRDGEYIPATETFSMPKCPAVPEGTASMAGLTDDYNWKIDQGDDFVLPEGETITMSRAKLHATYYVAGTWNVPEGFGEIREGATIYVLSTGTLNVGSTLQPGLTIYNYGTIKGNFTVGEGVILYSDVDINEVGEFSVNKGGEFFSKGSVFADEFVRLNGTVAACSFSADKIDIHDSGTVKTSYFEADDLTMNGGYVELDQNGLVKVKKLNITNNETRYTVNGDNAVVYAEEFNFSHPTHVPPMFAPTIACKFDLCQYEENGKKKAVAMNELGLQKYSEDMVVYVPQAGCHGAFGTTPEGGVDPDPEPPVVPGKPILEIKKVTDIDGHDHDHGIISATCINFGQDGKAYVSYHLRGNGKDENKNENYIGEYAQKGCIEVISDKGEAGLELGSYMIAPDWDFNHLIVDGNRIVTVGNSKTMSAFIGTLPVDFEASTGTDRDDFEVRELTTNEPIYGPSKDDPNTQIRIGFKNAGDGNCVVRQGNYYYVATYEGYGPLNLDFTRVNDAEGNKIFKKTNGSAKHISLNDNGKMAVIAHDTYDKTSSPASVYTFNATDYSFSNVLNTYSAFGTIEPVDGKNVIAMDGDQVYACLSKGGLVRVNDGKKWQKNNVPVNGMAFDDKYIYVANGSFVSVLDKATMEEICYYHASSQKSANYIALRNGKIYVAFGEDGLQVFELTEKTISE
ncbi:MAG: hypothetical protein K2H71_12300 [Muribaculaceae bacterium]|nr:hypothetical protein [Muribaculaceae bacterium]